MAQEKMVADTAAYKSIDGVLNEFLRLLSSEEGKTKNITAIRSLFLPTANFTVHTHDDSMVPPLETVELEEFLTLLKDPYYESGYKESGIHKIVEQYNGIAHVFQTYHAKDSDNYEELGITSYQLVQFNDRWWISNVLWTGNSNGMEIPEKYYQK